MPTTNTSRSSSFRAGVVSVSLLPIITLALTGLAGTSLPLPSPRATTG
jgi:hypothetical protein